MTNTKENVRYVDTLV